MSDYGDDLAQLVQIQQCVRKKIDRYRSAKVLASGPKEMLVKQVSEALCRYVADVAVGARLRLGVRGPKPDLPLQGLLRKLEAIFGSQGLALSRQRRRRGDEPLEIVKELLKCVGARDPGPLGWAWKRRNDFLP